MKLCSIRTSHVWLFAFCYAAVVSLIFQRLALPMMPALSAGSGLMKHDAFFYHQSALQLSEYIHQHGWSAWTPWSIMTHTSGNVGVLSALYALFGANPALVIPVNAALHATSAAMLVIIGREIFSGKTGDFAGIAAAVLFILFPTALSWYSQPLKDSYVIAGMLIIFYAWIRIFRPVSTINSILSSLILLLPGILLVAFVKPYYLKLLLPAESLVAFTVFIQLSLSKHSMQLRFMTFHILSGSLIAISLATVHPFMKSESSLNGESYSSPSYGLGSSQSSANRWTWRQSTWLPTPVERYIAIAASTRQGMIYFNDKVGATSLIDAQENPDSVSEVARYLPRALQIGLFAPFPNMWFDKPSATRLLAAAETMIWYIIAPGMLLALRKPSPTLITAMIFAGFFLTVFSFVTPNIGTLYRYRYPYEFLLIAISLGGWLRTYPDILKVRSHDRKHQFSKTRLLHSATGISILTLLGYLGFFARDLFMVRSFGAGKEMDIFYLGSTIPMFMVSIFTIPIGTAIIPAYSELRNTAPTDAHRKLISNTLFFLTLSTAVIATILYFLAPYIFTLLGWHYSGQHFSAIISVMNVYLIIMLIGGLIIVANAVLNAEGHLLFPAAAQMIVPIFTITAFAAFGESHGIFAAVYGMLVGQVANLAILTYKLRNQFSFIRFHPEPRFFLANFPFRQYGILAAAATASAMLVPMGNIIASYLPQGSVTIIGMGNKVIMLIIGVIGMGMTTVLLPYFSSLAAKSRHLKAQYDLSLFLISASIISVPASLILRLLAASMTYQLVSGSAMSHDSINALIRTIQFGMAQLPFYICSLIIMKYITAFSRAGILLLSSLLGLLLTITLSLIFTVQLGISGVALAITVSMAISTSVLVFYVSRIKHLPLQDIIFIFSFWIIFSALFAGLHFHDMSILIVFGIAFIGLSLTSLKNVLGRQTHDKDQEAVTDTAG